ncbi:MAG TPA: hypothetical protein VKW77_02710, partial [Acidimicrobiales bacterium]|nr:hypothetical protein [Acidimicrobiales bacterium]
MLDACASGPPVLNNPNGSPVSFSWLVWPDAAEPVLVLVNRGTISGVQLGTVTMTELADLPAAPPVVEPGADVARTLGLYLADPNALDRFGGGGSTGLSDTLTLAHNLGQYLTYCGTSSIVLSEALADRPQRRSLDGQADEDAIGPDRLDLLLRILSREGFATWLELNFDGPLPGLPAPDSAEALARGLVRVDRRGLADSPATYHSLHPDVREAMKRRVAEALAPRKSRPSPNGLLVRLGPGPTLLGGPDTGFDDNTFARFVRESLDPETARHVPGLGTADPNRFAARSEYLAGPGRMPWMVWRARGIAALYGEL